MNDPGEQAKSLIRDAILAARMHVDSLGSRPRSMCLSSKDRAEQFIVSLRRELLMRRPSLGEPMAKRLVDGVCDARYWADAGVLSLWVASRERGTVSEAWFRSITEKSVFRTTRAAMAGMNEMADVGFGGLAEIIGRASSIVADAERINTGSDAVVRGLIQALS